MRRYGGMTGRYGRPYGSYGRRYGVGGLAILPATVKPSTDPAKPEDVRIYGMVPRQLRVAGVALSSVGVVLFLLGMLVMFGVFGRGLFGLTGSTLWMGVALVIAGMVPLSIGGTFLQYGYARQRGMLMAMQMAPMMEMASQLGVTNPGFGVPSGTVTQVRVKCRSCGFLDTEDATYCSKCGQPL